MEQMMRTIIECSLTMTAIALALLLLTPPLQRRFGAKCLYLAWVIVLIGFAVPLRPRLAPAAITMPMPQASPWRAPPARPAGEREAALLLPGEATGQGNEAQALGQGQESEQPLGTAEQPAWASWGRQVIGRAAALSAQQIMAGVWLLGFAGVLAFRLARHRRFLRTIRRWSKPIESDIYQGALREAKAALGIRARVGLYRCPSVDSPMLVGLLRPRILLPSTSLPLAEVYLVLRHELIHLRRGDLWGRLLALFASAAHWFNPLMPLISRAFSTQCELSCDALVTEGMSPGARQYYGETIIHSLRPCPAASTELSTHYYGGKQLMKQRILQILDTRAKRTGAPFVALLLASVLCAGMAFALSPETDGQPSAALAGPAMLSEEGRVAELNAKLASVVEKYYIPTASTNLHAFAFPSGPIDDALYEENMALLDACASFGDVVSLYKRAGLVRIEADEQTRSFVEGALEAAGLGNLTAGIIDHQYHQISHNLYGHGWNALAGDTTLAEDKGMGAELTILEGRIDRLVCEPVNFSAQLDALTPEQKQAARDRAVAFAREYVYLLDPSCEHVLTSDYAYKGPMDEPYTTVWIFNTAIPMLSKVEGLPYSEEDHESNMGFQMDIGVGTGIIYGITPFSTETSFVNRCSAQADWVAHTGLEYPYPDTDYIWDVIYPMMSGQMRMLHARYGAGLTDQEHLMAEHLTADAYTLSGPAGGWKALQAAMDACRSEEDFRALIHGEYIGLNQTLEGEPDAAEIIERARPTLEALGYGHLTNLSFAYIGPFSDPRQPHPFYEVKAMGEYDPLVPLYGQNIITLAVDKGGRFIHLEESALSRLAGDSKPITDLEREQVAEAAMNIATNLIALPGTLIPDSLEISEKTYPAADGARKVQVTVQFETEWETDSGETLAERSCLLMTIGAEDGRLYEQGYSSVERGADHLDNYSVNP